MLSLKKKRSFSFRVFGFTLVELIVVITILAILGTIAFLSFGSVAGSARDSARLTDLRNASNGMGLFRERFGQFPMPENITGTGKIGTNIISYVWIIGDRLAGSIGISKAPVDPLIDTIHYFYGVTWNQRMYQIAITLEDGTNLTYSNGPFIDTAYADGNNIARVEGNYKGVITFSSWSELWVANVPSLIYSFSGNVTSNLLDSDKTLYVTNKNTNLPYTIGTFSDVWRKNWNQILSELTGTATILKAVKIPTSIAEFNQSSSLYGDLWYSIMALWQAIYGDRYLSDSSTTLLASAPPPATPTCLEVATPGDFTFNAWVITDYSGTWPKNVDIPCKIGWEAVTSIWPWAFASKSLTSVTIPGSIATIGLGAFMANQIASVTISNGVTSIWNQAFAINQLTNVTIPNSVTSIWNEAFRQNQLTNVTIPDGVTNIWYVTFWENQLTNVVLPNSVTTIWQQAFYNNQLTNVVLPNSVTTIWQQAFYLNKLANLTIPDGVTDIWYQSFGNNRLTSVTIPSSVAYIRDWAFSENLLTAANVTIHCTAATLPVILPNSFAFNWPWSNIDIKPSLVCN